MRKWNQKGFSLVELIIVIAIMAVLMAVLAPAMLTYVEKTRMQKDESALDEILNTTHLSLSVDEVYNKSWNTGVYVSIKNGELITSNSEPLQNELRRIIAEPVVFKSKKYIERGQEKIDITFSNPHGRFILDASWVEGDNN